MLSSVTHSFAFCFTLLFSVFFSSMSFAHALKVFAYLEGDLIKGSVYFVGGAPAKGAEVRLDTPDGQRLQTLVADQEGEFTSAPVTAPLIHVVADSHDGHVGQWIVKNTRAEIPAESSIKNPNAQQGNASLVNVTTSGITSDELEAVVERAVAAQVAPLREELHRYQNSARLSDILGGVGVIFGLAGAALWYSSRKSSKHVSNEKTAGE
ncbi:hypothetical protein ACFOEK_20535 [Litoribrevibacter euphylliae]|uniref:Nickel transport protein n=1 Tax=Litoribrevibacter euphylliae TaxID=1834034 RepID=A0ABV7HMR7_9GAMM